MKPSGSIICPKCKNRQKHCSKCDGEGILYLMSQKDLEDIEKLEDITNALRCLLNNAAFLRANARFMRLI